MKFYKRITKFAPPSRIGFRLIRCNALPLAELGDEIRLSQEGCYTRISLPSEGMVKVNGRGSQMLVNDIEMRGMALLQNMLYQL